MVAVAVKTKTYSEYGSFKRKLKICATVVNHILHADRFIVKKSGKAYRMRNFLDQTFNAFVQELCIENKDCDFTRPGQGAGEIGTDDEVDLDDDAAATDGSAGANRYFAKCIHQLSADIEGEVYKTKITIKAEVEKEREVLKSINLVLAQSGKNLPIPPSTVVISEEDMSSMAECPKLLSAATATNGAGSTSTTSAPKEPKDENAKLTPHKLNLLNQQKSRYCYERGR